MILCYRVHKHLHINFYLQRKPQMVIDKVYYSTGAIQIIFKFSRIFMVPRIKKREMLVNQCPGGIALISGTQQTL